MNQSNTRKPKALRNRVRKTNHKKALRKRVTETKTTGQRMTVARKTKNLTQLDDVDYYQGTGRTCLFQQTGHETCLIYKVGKDCKGSTECEFMNTVRKFTIPSSEFVKKEFDVFRLGKMGNKNTLFTAQYKHKPRSNVTFELVGESLAGKVAEVGTGLTQEGNRYIEDPFPVLWYIIYQTRKERQKARKNNVHYYVRLRGAEALMLFGKYEESIEDLYEEYSDELGQDIYNQSDSMLLEEIEGEYEYNYHFGLEDEGYDDIPSLLTDTDTETNTDSDIESFLEEVGLN